MYTANKNAASTGRRALFFSSLYLSLLLAACGGGGDIENLKLFDTPITNGSSNAAPTVSAGEDQTVDSGKTVSLNGTASDSDGTIATYLWSESNTSDLTITDATSASASFVAPNVTEVTAYTLNLSVTDNQGLTVSDLVQISVQPVAAGQPIANAGVDQIVDEGAAVNLGGSGTDAGGSIAGYLWEETSAGGITLSNATSAIASFTAPTVANTTTYTFRLTVTDNEDNTDQDTATVTVRKDNSFYLNNWMINTTDERSQHITDDASLTGTKTLVNVQSVSETTIDGLEPAVLLNASGVPNYAHVPTIAEIDWLNARPKGTDFGAPGSVTLASAGVAVAFGADIGYNAAMGCTSASAGGGYWPPGPECPQNAGHSNFFRTEPVEETVASEVCTTGLGTIGSWVNGVSVFNWGDGQSYNNENVWNNLAPAFEVYDLDICHGHAAVGEYHHHSYPHCLAEQLGDDGSGHSAVFGFAADGYPIYGPYEAIDQLAKSCWVARDYSASVTAGGCADGARSCQLVDVFDLTKGVSIVSNGPALGGTTTTQSGNTISASSGIYYEDYYFDMTCKTQAPQNLDEHNGHDNNDGRGYHYHVTVVDDSVNKTLGIDLLPVFPYFIGPDMRGEVPSSWQCGGGSDDGVGRPGVARPSVAQ